MAASALVALALAALAPSALAQQQPGTFKIVGDTLVSAMMLFLGNEDSIYILDKTEGNNASINGHPAWGSVWNLTTNTATVVDVVSNSFCASGAVLANGTLMSFGGNNAISPGPVDYHGAPGTVDPVYQDVVGRQAYRWINPNGNCDGPVEQWTADCQWNDNPSIYSMQSPRWYSTAETLADGEIIIIGGMVNGGYINRPGPNPKDPVTQNGMASNTFEFFPVRPGFTPQTSQFLVGAGALNTYVLSFLMASGKVFMQANVTAILFNTTSFEEEPLPNMPNNVVRVYPASGASAMLPLTPENNYTPTILFCGGTNSLTDYDWGGYGGPNCNAWEFATSNDCQRLTPEPVDGSTPQYEQDDNMPEGRTMGELIALPDGTYMIFNGAQNGTAGYTTQTPEIPVTANLPFGLSLATDPVLTPAIYDPNQPLGKRWTRDGLFASTIPRMYHSTAMLLPDGSVFVAGSNPNGDVNATVNYALPFPAEYRAEIFYPLYWGKQRPEPSGIPDSVSYGGDYMNISLPNGSYPGTPNDAAANTKAVLLRDGFATHAVHMGQRMMYLNTTYTVSDNGDITLHVSQAPPNPNLMTPGPSLFFVVTNGVPSQGKIVTVGSGQREVQPTAIAAALPPVTTSSTDTASGNDNNTSKTGSSTHSPSIGLIVGAAAAGVAAAAALAALVICICRRRSNRSPPANQPFDSNQAFIGAAVAGNQPYGQSASGFATPAGQQEYNAYNPYGAGAAPGAVTGAPFAAQGYGRSQTPSESDVPVQPHNYDAYASARLPSSYSVNSQAPAQSPRAEYYDPYRR